MQKGIKFRIYPNREQKNLIHRTLGCCRLIYHKEMSQIRPGRAASVFYRIYPNGDQPPDLILFTVDLKRKKLPFHFITQKCDPEQHCHSHIPADLWRKQPVAGNAGRGMPCAGIERGVFTQTTIKNF